MKTVTRYGFEIEQFKGNKGYVHKITGFTVSDKKKETYSSVLVESKNPLPNGATRLLR